MERRSAILLLTASLIVLWGAALSATDGTTSRSTTTSGSDVFAFEEDPEDNPYRQNARNRTPIYIPGRCGHNEILYPGDRLDDWVCDCRPAHVYYPGTLGCYPLYTQAYCAKGEYVIIPPNSKLPRCTVNTCPEGKIPFREKCVTLNRKSDEVCPTIQRIKYVVGVNEVTLQLDCIPHGPIDLNRITINRVINGTSNWKEVIVTDEGNVLFLNAIRCSPGSIAQTNGLCPESLEASQS